MRTRQKLRIMREALKDPMRWEILDHTCRYCCDYPVAYTVHAGSRRQQTCFAHLPAEMIWHLERFPDELIYATRDRLAP